MLWRWSVQWRKNDHVREAASLIEGEWSCYGGGQFKGGSGHVIVFSLMEEWSSYGGGQEGEWRENDYVREVASLMEGEWSRYGGGQFSGQRMVMLQKWSV